MNHVKGFSIVAILFLTLQVISPNLGLLAESTFARSDDKSKIDVKHVEQNEAKLTWNVTINPSGEESAGTKTAVTMSAGQKPLSIENENDSLVEQTENGYVIETPQGNQTYELELVTEITDEKVTTFDLKAEVDIAGEVYKAEDRVEVEKKQVEEQKAEPKEKDSESKEEAERVEEPNTTKEENGEQNKEKQTEKNPKSAENELSELEEKEVIGEPHPPFARTMVPNALPGVRSGSNWPSPGSLKLTKDAEETSNYAEWEVELTVKGKNLKTSSDIVIVFDRSNSMYASRLKKAKNAAKQFVDNLLIEGSSTRIALVPFGTTHDPHTDFKDYSGKQTLKNAIDAIQVTGGNDGGTNIQAGLHQAKELLNGSNADQKTIVLLSDGEPTYSFRAGSASSFSWPNNKYNFILSNFNYNDRLGSGSSYNYSSGWFGHQYTVNGHSVKTNGIPTLSEAKHIMNAGIGIYSVGLEVGNNNNAKYVLQHSQNKGYYAGGDDDLGPIFNEIAAKLNYPATEAVVTDPLGDMFDLVKDGSYNGNNFVASHGTASWDDASETFTWDIGDIKEGEVYSLTYKVMLDCTKNPEGNVKYPTNKETPLNYKNSNGNSATKQFPIPEVEVDKGKITKKGYRVNADGDPMDSSGNVVSSPAEAEQFYDELFGDNLTLGSTYSVPANDVADYTLLVGDDPTDVQLTAGKVCETVWFGYAKTTELKAGDVTAKYVDEDGNEIADEEVFSGNIGDSYTTVQKAIPGYEFKEMHPNSDPVTGTFKKDPQTVIYVYTKSLGSLTVNKVDENGDALQGAVFTLTGPEGYETTGTSNGDGEIVFENLEWGTYTLVETKAPEGYRLLTGEMEVEITKEILHVTKEVENTRQDWEIPKTGGIGTLGFYGVGLLLMVAAVWFVIRRRQA